MSYVSCDIYFIIASLEVDAWVHELTHLLFDQAVASPRVIVPAWLSEGIAMYFESNRFRTDTLLEQAVKSGSLIRLQQMGVVPGQPSDVSLFYAQSRSFVAFLIDTYGEDRMSAMIFALNRGQPIDEALMMTYGKTNLQLESAWHSELHSINSSRSAFDFGALGTPFLIIVVISVTAIIISLRGITRVRTKRE